MRCISNSLGTGETLFFSNVPKAVRPYVNGFRKQGVQSSDLHLDLEPLLQQTNIGYKESVLPLQKKC